MMSAASPLDPTTAPLARPTVLSLAIKEKAALYAALRQRMACDE